MSKATVHKETYCLNCGEALHGEYCSKCGQKAFLHKESFWHMTFHFVGHYFHYDGKFWTTLKTLFTKPGMATTEYIAGKRAKYLNPIQLYFFTTTFFFLLFFTLTDQHINTPSTGTRLRDSVASAIRQESRMIIDSTLLASKEQDPVADQSKTSSKNGEVEFSCTPGELASYDSIQNTLPPAQRDGPILHFFLHRFSRITQNEDTTIADFFETLLHHFPKVFFLLLPWFAFCMWLVFYRYKLYFVDHLVFSIHYHAFLFMLGIFLFLLYRFHVPYSVKGLVTTSAIVYAGAYLYASLRRVFPGSRVPTLLKQVFLTVTYFVGFIFALVAILLFTFASV